MKLKKFFKRTFDTSGLDLDVFIKERARVMLTNHVDISDKLINKQLVAVAQILVYEVTEILTIVCITFNEKDAGNLVIDKCPNIFATENKNVLMKPILAQIKLNLGKLSSPEV